MRRLPEVIIRNASEQDAEAMAAFMAGLSAEALDTVTRRAPPSADDERAFVRNAESAERAFILLALCGAEVVGLLDLWAGASRRGAARGRRLGGILPAGVGGDVLEHSCHPPLRKPRFQGRSAQGEGGEPSRRARRDDPDGAYVVSSRPVAGSVPPPGQKAPPRAGASRGA